MTNKELLEKYPFIVLRNSMTGEIVKQNDDNNPYVEFKDDIPEGGWKSFGIQYLDDFKEMLDKYNINYDKVIFFQVKEKYGCLRVYHNGVPEEWYQHEHVWEYISEHTCVECGKFPVPMRYFSGMCSYCDEHAKSHREWSEDNDVTENNGDGRVYEYLVVNHYTIKDGDYEEGIDMKPYYDKIGGKYTNKDLILKDEIEEIIKNKKEED